MVDNRIRDTRITLAVAVVSLLLIVAAIVYAFNRTMPENVLEHQKGPILERLDKSLENDERIIDAIHELKESD